MEIFKSILGYEGFYEISNMGNLRSLDRTCSNGRFYLGKNIKLSNDKDGYSICSITKNGCRKMIKVHRIVYESFFGDIEKGLHVDHIDGNKQNNKLENLQAITPRENNEKKFRDKNGRCGYKPMGKKFQVRKSYGGISYSLGVYDTEVEAQKIYDDADLDYCEQNRKTR
jgi:hypothetical protein